MTIKQLIWQETQPNTEQVTELLPKDPKVDLLTLQPRLHATLLQLISSLNSESNNNSYASKFMLLKADDSELMLSLLRKTLSPLLPSIHSGVIYHVNEDKITMSPSKNPQDNFASTDHCLSASWFNYESLFGGVRQPKDGVFKLYSGLVHHANGGVLILGLRALLSQPILFERLKRMVTNGIFEWLSADDSSPYPVTIPSMPLNLRVILVGDRISLSDLQDYDPIFFNSSLYTEFENFFAIRSQNDRQQWADYIRFLADIQGFPTLENSALIELIKAGARYTEAQHYLPISPDWLQNQLMNAVQFIDNNIDQQALKKAIDHINWRENYLTERLREGIFSNQTRIQTQKDDVVGQINGLSVIQYPGHPKEIGEPTRLSCVIHFGDGDIIDVDSKSDLAGNLHSKGMMIMHAFLTSEFAITHQLPFTASLVFEQSYSEVDGDSASLAGLCVLMSALSGQPIDQQIAVTGSVDQFGNVQAIGGVNEKIEGFFAICKHQGLTGEQGVIIPASNQHNLCLEDEVVIAIKEKQFSIWTVENVAEALYLLMGIPYRDENTLNLYQLIQARIQIMMNNDKRSSSSWLSKWLK